MAQISNILIEKIKLFVKELENEKLRISKVFLFGSYARNQENEWSDIDLAVVSDDFTGNRMIDYDRFVNAILKVDRSFEPIPYKTENFTIDNPFVYEIISTGIRII
jgi:predicted nucleotidyltransferase